MSGDIWDGTTQKPSVLIEKDGIFYYAITKCSELAYVSETGGDCLKYNYMLNSNLILNNIDIKWDDNGECINAQYLIEWTPINDFTGIFDRNGFFVSGLYVNQKENNNIRLFGSAVGSIKDLSVINSYLYGNSNVGGIIGNFNIPWNGNSVIRNCMFSGYVCAHTSHAGGIIGYTQGGGLSNLTNYGTIQADSNAGGITSYAYRLYNCTNYGDVSYRPGNGNLGTNIGGIAALGATYKYCVNYGTVTGVSCVGGIYGSEGGGTHDPEGCENKGYIYGDNQVGGIAGFSSDEGIQACKNSGTVVGKEFVGGIVGYRGVEYYPNSFSIEDVYNVGTVSEDNYVGGIIGYARDETKLSNAYNIGLINAMGIAGALLCADNYMWGGKLMCLIVFTIKIVHHLYTVAAMQVLALIREGYSPKQAKS